MNKHELPQLNWTWANSLPYILATLIPTILLLFGFISGAMWCIIFVILIVGVGLADLRSMKIAGNSFTFEEDEDDDS